MKRNCMIFVMVLCLLCSLLSFGGAEEIAPLTVDEVDAYLDFLVEEVLKNEKPEIVEDKDNGLFYAHFSGGVLMMADSELKQETAIVGARLGMGTQDMRGIAVEQDEERNMKKIAPQDVMKYYPCSNENLSGTYNEAVVAMDGTLPGMAFAGLVTRDGQRVETMEYVAYESINDTVAKAGVTYHFENNQLTGITVEGRSESEFYQEEMDKFAALQEENSYFAYPVSSDGKTLDMFVREDLIFSGMDFLSVTPEMMADRFGRPLSDEWIEDTDHSYLRVCRWENFELTLRYDTEKKPVHVLSLNVTGSMLEGPRGVRIGDSMDSILCRFRHGEGKNQESALVLYGDGETAPYGVISYEGSGAYITYTTDTPDGVVALQLNCSGMRLDNFVLLLLENE